MSSKHLTMDLGGCTSLKDIILLAIERQRHCLALLLVVAETIFLIWTERNVVVFRGKWAVASTILIWRRVTANLKAVWTRIMNPTISRSLSRDINLIRGRLDDPSIPGDLSPDYNKVVLAGLFLAVFGFPVVFEGSFCYFSVSPPGREGFPSGEGGFPSPGIPCVGSVLWAGFHHVVISKICLGFIKKTKHLIKLNGNSCTLFSKVWIWSLFPLVSTSIINSNFIFGGRTSKGHKT